MNDRHPLQTAVPGATPAPPRSLFAETDHARRRKAAEARFKLYGVIAIAIGIIAVLLLVFTIVARGTGAFQQSFVSLPVELLEAKLDKKGNRNLDDIKKVSTFGYAPLIKNGFNVALAEAGIETDLKPKELSGLLSKSAVAQLRNYVIANPDRIGTTVAFEFLASSRVDGYLKGPCQPRQHRQ